MHLPADPGLYSAWSIVHVKYMLTYNINNVSTLHFNLFEHSSIYIFYVRNSHEVLRLPWLYRNTNVLGSNSFRPWWWWHTLDVRIWHLYRRQILTSKELDLRPNCRSCVWAVSTDSLSWPSIVCMMCYISKFGTFKLGESSWFAE